MKEVILKENGKYLIPANSEIKKHCNYLLITDIGLNDFKVDLVYSLQTSVIQIDQPLQIKSVKVNRVIDRYEYNGKELSVEEYNQMKHDLYFKFNDEDGDFCGNIDQEYAWKKFQQSAIPQWVDKTTERVYDEFQILPIITSKYTSIRPVNSFVNNPEDMLFIYNKERRCLMNEAVADTPFSYIINNHEISKSTEQLVISEHSNFEYVKNKDGYIKGDWPSSNNFRGTYEECVRKRAEDIQEIKNILFDILSKKRKDALDQVSVGVLIRDLDRIKNEIRCLDVKQSAKANVSSILTKMNKMVSLLQESSKYVSTDT